MYAIKGNRQYTITEAEKAAYVANGYDIMEDGEIIATGAGKTVPYAQYQAVVQENEALKAAGNTKAAKDLKTAQDTIKSLESELAELKKTQPEG